MPSAQYVVDRFAEIETTIEHIQNGIKGDGNEKISAYLASYLAVYISGVYEDCIEHLVIERAKQAKDSMLVSFITATVDLSFRNPEYAKVKELISKFDPQYGIKLRGMIDDNAIEALNSIKTNKDQTAHGKPTQATFKDIIGYHARAVSIFDAVEKILGVAPSKGAPASL